ncbi:bifunctional 4-hydroxy-2-oxoglutarate aldolase/2-dehydro-3-deoxy-phosphogluconate aldolase [Legionella cardiaca]|uniref:Bifunctional 4-hydroxy-2-oxoglutarate aldolase/2-dehydro-3-deoxy-phosphogluconate aldolase n=1 Tax=Legionella cardiaca TaxID=1071983 RepID=A0ABY8AVU7_9GAMM|nr:bifunctional 4-hydroxy-2-oxoglutarate aldolase/2-dehydro-3-deoxy-phosphogluconate aldolase [Legionella cardiaca]WED43854.1 bifunctional 4-hydroxy-2-oxoglutarate aldolase/2-dehydro-3-deoxy-phosphogluconate aldolase [Legionella cardiaca]
MMTDKLFDNQSIIVTLDVDAFLFDRLKQVASAGFAIVEINSSEQEILKKVLQDFPSLRIGSGNITNTQQLEDSYQAGVHFTSSPGFLPAIAQTAAIYSMNYLPGIATISEAMQVMALGYHQARPYPANLAFCASLNKCLPMLRLFPAEIEWDEAEHYLSLPAVAAVSIINPESKQLYALSTGAFA